MLFRLKYWGSSYWRRKSRVKPVFTERLEDRILLFAGADSPADIVSIVSASSMETAAPEIDYADADQSDIVGNFYLPPQYHLNGAGALLSAPTSGTPLEIATGFLNQQALKLGLDSHDLSQFIVTSQYTDERSGTSHLYLRQTLNGIQVVNADINISITAKGEVIHAASSFVSDAHVVDGSSSQIVVNASQAFMGWSDYLGLGIDSPTRVISIDTDSPDSATVFSVDGTTIADVAANLVYVPTAGGLELAWRLDVHDTNYTHWLDAFVSASTGDAIYTDNRIGNATYNVFALPARSPIDGARSIVNDPQDATASPSGWNDTNGVAGAEFTDTRGNNAIVQEDVNADDAGGFRPSGGAGLNFDFPLDTTQDPFNSQSAAIANAFYWVNLLHDIHYQYGFTEAAGNFQVNNYGRGGAGNDPVIVDVQDGASVGGGGFAALPDGQSPRMTMQRWTGPFRDGSLDSDILIHEFGHGISERLTGGPGNTSALNAVQSRAMSEGWGDWWAIMLTQVPSDAKLDAYPIGNYVAGYAANGPGIRVYPYSFDMTIDPLTYNNFNGGAANNESHKAGTIWASALWDMNWLLIDKYGFSSDMLHGTGGNNLAMQLVMDGLKLQGTNPSFLAGRDAILAADVALTGGQNQTEIWKAFARRGMGYSASDGGGAGSTTVVQAFDVPASISGTVFRDDDGSGTQNGAEPGLAGRTVYLDLNNNGVLDVSTTAVFNSTDTPKPLPDAPNILSTRTISGLSGVITDINVTVNIAHPNVGDLYVTLISPANTPVILANYLGGTGDNYTNTTFDDEAATYIYSASAPFSGSFRPFFDLAQLDGRDPNGTWKLRIDDRAAGNTGTLLSWSMQISYGNPDRTAVTDANGNYSFYGLGNATHHIRDVVPAGFTQTSPVSGVQNVTISDGQSVNGRNFGLLAAATVSNTTALEDTLSPAIIINPANGLGINYFKISGIIGGTLFKNNGVTAINNGDFITVAEGQAGVKFLPSANSNVAGHIDVELSQNGTSVLAQTSKASATISVTAIGDTPQVASIVTLEDSLSGPIVIGRNPNDGNEVTHFKISGIAGGLLFKSDGVTQINNGSFITFVEAQAGVRFLPSANNTSDGHFDVESSQNGSSVAAQSGKATSTITVTPIGDTPVVASLLTLEDTLSGPIVIGRHPNDGSEVTHFKISGISGGSLFKSDGVTQINNGSFITFAEAQAGIRFLPSVNSTSDGHFDVESSQNGSTVAAQSGKATSTITVTSVNDVPTIDLIPDPPAILQDAGLQSIGLNGISVGGGEVQTLTIVATSDNTDLISDVFVTYSQGSTTATLSYTPIANQHGVATVTVTVSDGGQGGLVMRQFVVKVLGVNNAPISLNLSSTVVTENQPVGTVVGTFSTLDSDSGNTFTYTLAAGTGDTNNSSFQIVGNQVRTSASFDFESVAEYSIRVESTDQDGLSVAAIFHISVQDANEPPTGIILQTIVSSLPENVSTVVAIPLAGIQVTDDALGSETLTLAGPDAAIFEIVGNELRLRSGVALNFETRSSYSVTINADDPTVGTTSDAFVVFGLTITNVNETPTDIGLSSTGLAENNAPNAAVGTFSALDPDSNDTFTYSLIPGIGSIDNASFGISGNVLTIKPVTDFEAKSSYAIRVQVTDQGGLTFEKPLTVNVTNVNEAPIYLVLSATNIVENNVADAIVGTFSAADPDSGGTFTYGLVAGAGSTDNSSFNISGNTLTITPVANFEAKSSYAIRIRVTDQGGLTFEKPFTINVTNVNEPPTDLALSATSIAENNAANATVGTISAIDPDSGSTFSYGLVGGAGSTDNGSFAIAGNVLKISAITNFEAKSTYALRISVTDQSGLTYEKPLTINVANVNEAPTDVALSMASISENNSANAAVGAFNGIDPDSGSTFTYSLVAGTGSTDNASFAIAGNTLTVKPVTDFETKSSYTIRVRVTDQGGLSFEKSLTINVINVNEAPNYLILSLTNLAENNAINATVGTISGIDLDSGSVFTYSLVPGTGSTDNSSFAIVGNTLAISVVANFEAQSSYAIRLCVTDQGGLSFEKPLIINVTNINEAPTDLTLSAISIAENNAANAPVGTLSGSDPDFSGTFTYSLVAGVGSTDNGSFAITGNVLKISPATNFETKSSYAIRVRVTDQGGLSFEKPLTINVTNVNEAPNYLILSLTNLSENNAINATVGTLSGIDTDAGSILSYSLVPGTGSTDNGNFAIVGNALTISAVANYEIKSSYAIRLCVTDQGGLSFEKPFTINVTNINEAPADLTLSTTSIAENNAVNATVGTLSGSDPDSGDTYIYSLVAGTGSTDNASFAITGNTLTIKPVTDFETKSSYAIRVRVTDQGGLSVEKSLTISVTNVNEAPMISKIAAQVIPEDSTTGSLQFYIGDPDSSVGDLIVTATSSNSLLIPNSNLVISGTSVNRSVIVTPLANQNGSSIITLSVSDGLLSSSQSFQVKVQPVDDPTTITMSQQPIVFHISSKAVLAVDPAAAVSDVDTPTLLFAGSILKVSGQSSKDTLSIIEQNGIDVKGKSVLYGGTVIGTVSGGTKAEALTVQFNAGATQNAIQILLRSIGFKTTDKLAGSRIIKFQITKLGGVNTNNATRQIQVGP